MTQTGTQSWSAETYQENGSFVPALGAGVLEWLTPQPGEQILDIGCGDGQLTAQIAASGASVAGIDTSDAMLEAAHRRGLRVERMSAEELTFKNQFDAVFSNAALHWINNQDVMLAGVHRALKPGGRFVAEMGGHGNIAAINVALDAALRNHGYSLEPWQRNYFPSPKAYSARLVAHGFIVKEIQLIPRPTLLPHTGMRGWLLTFRRGVFDALPIELHEQVLDDALALLEPVLRDELGNWVADYMRLRFRAIAR